MNQDKIRADGNAARRLIDDATFQGVIEKIRDDAVALFLNPASGIDTIAAAHERIRGIETVLAEIHSRIGAIAVLDKREKAQDRGND